MSKALRTTIIHLNELGEKHIGFMKIHPRLDEIVIRQ
uniref:Transcriptional regulator n=1 Tax=Heterorhabditis bacteriophora TaxID=37862 RepID=A0A1I7W7Q1_HETBA